MLALLAAALASPAHADAPQPDPAIYLQAFNDTCRRGFPDLDAIAANALAQGWRDSAMRPVGGGPDPLAMIKSRALHRGGLMLFLTELPDGPVARVCQITAPEMTRASGAEVTALVGASLHAGAPTLVRDKEHDAARWTVAPGMTVEAGIAIYRKMRTISLLVRKER